MKLYKLFVCAMIAALTILSVSTSAKNKRVPKIYAFGFSASFNDSTIYFTNIQEIDSVWVNDKNNFLIDRDNYSYQLKNYFEGQGMPHRTCVISYGLKRKDVEKKFRKMRDKYVKRGGCDIKMVDANAFHFTPIELSE